jgi:WD40 repeat protein
LVWNIDDPNRPRLLDEPLSGDDPMYGVDFSADGHIVATADWGGVVQLWDVHDPNSPHRIGSPWPEIPELR